MPQISQPYDTVGLTTTSNRRLTIGNDLWCLNYAMRDALAHSHSAAASEKQEPYLPNDGESGLGILMKLTIQGLYTNGQLESRASLLVFVPDQKSAWHRKHHRRVMYSSAEGQGNTDSQESSAAHDHITNSDASSRLLPILDLSVDSYTTSCLCKPWLAIR